MKILKTKKIFESKPFGVEEVEVEGFGSWHRLDCQDYVTVLPIINHTHAVLVKQFRIGSSSYTLETPGGMVDPEESKDPTQSAMRELEEETGLQARRLLPLASISPNPALQNNKIHMFVATDCHPAEKRTHFPDHDERIELVPVPISDLEMMVRTGQIDHSLSALCIMLAHKYLKVDTES